MRKNILTVAIGMAVASMALAQTSLTRQQEGAALAAITAVEGATCERVVRTAAIGELDDSTTLMAVACAGGQDERYVIRLNQGGDMTFYATCANLAEGTNNQVRCFAGTQEAIEAERRRRDRR